MQQAQGDDPPPLDEDLASADSMEQGVCAANPARGQRQGQGAKGVSGAARLTFAHRQEPDSRVRDQVSEPVRNGADPEDLSGSRRRVLSTTLQECHHRGFR